VKTCIEGEGLILKKGEEFLFVVIRPEYWERKGRNYLVGFRGVGSI